MSVRFCLVCEWHRWWRDQVESNINLSVQIQYKKLSMMELCMQNVCMVLLGLVAITNGFKFRKLNICLGIVDRWTESQVIKCSKYKIKRTVIKFRTMNNEYGQTAIWAVNRRSAQISLSIKTRFFFWSSYLNSCWHPSLPYRRWGMHYPNC